MTRMDSCDDAPDVALIERSAKGDLFAFGTFATRHRNSLVRYCESRIEDWHLAQDITQDVIVAFLEQVKEGRLPDDPVSWVIGIARHQCQEVLRRRSKHQLASLTDEVTVRDGLDAIDLRDELETFDENERTVFRMRYEQSLKCREIADQLGKSVSSITNTLSRIHQKFRSST